MNTYAIKTNESITKMEPTIGAWYCGMTIPEYDPENFGDIDGEFAQYVGEGQFVCDGHDWAERPNPNMNYYDYLLPA